MSNNQPTNNKETSAPLFASGLFTTNTTGSLFGTTGQAAASTGTSGTGAIGMFGNGNTMLSPFSISSITPNSNTTTSPSLFSGLGGFQSGKNAQQTSKNITSIAPFSSQPTQFDQNKMGGLFSNKGVEKKEEETTKRISVDNQSSSINQNKGGLFDSVNQASSSSSLFGSKPSIGLFSNQPSLAPVQAKQQEIKNKPSVEDNKTITMFQSGSFFGSNAASVSNKQVQSAGMFSGMFGKQQTKQLKQQNKESKLEKQPPALFSGSLFGSGSALGNIGGLFGGPAKPNELKPNQNQSVNQIKVPSSASSGSLFSSTPLFGQKSTPQISPSANESKPSPQIEKTVSAPSLFVKSKSQIPPPLFSAKTIQQASKQKILPTNQKISPIQLTSVQKQQQKLNPQSIIRKTHSTQLKQPTSSQSKQPNQTDKQPNQPDSNPTSHNSSSLFANTTAPTTAATNKPASAKSQSLFSFTAQSEPIKNGALSAVKEDSGEDGLSYSFRNLKKAQNTMNSTEPTKASNNGSLGLNTEAMTNVSTSKRMTDSFVISDGQQDVKQSQMIKQADRTYISIIRDKQGQSSFIEFKKLLQEESSQTFNLFLNQKKKDIVQSLKLYFTTSNSQTQPKLNPDNNSEKDNFYFDLTNLMIVRLGLNYSSFPVMHSFLLTTIAEQKYDSALFKANNLNVQYFLQYSLYVLDSNRKRILNQYGSAQLQMLMFKLISRWNGMVLKIINFVFKYMDLVRVPTSDLFCYLFKYLLSLQSQVKPRQIQNLKNVITEGNSQLKNRLCDLLNYFNKALGKNYKMIEKTELNSIIKLIQINSQERIVSIALKILLNSIDLRQTSKTIPQEMKAFIQTKSLALLPFRIILSKYKYINQQLCPSPKDLYAYTKGNEWLNWFDIILTHSRTDSMQLQIDEPKIIVDCLRTIDGALLLPHLLDKKRGIFRLFNLLRQQNLQCLYYNLLQSCISDGESIRKIQQFYFKKMYFNYEYQQIIEYVINFNHNQDKLIMNEDAIIDSLQPKISLLAKIIAVDPQQIGDKQKSIFNSNFNTHKRFKNNQEETTSQSWHRLGHIFVDLINIYSCKGLKKQRLIGNIFKTITSLLKNKKTQPVMIEVLNINRPSFNFTNQYMSPCTIQAVNQLIDHIISQNYIYDLIIDFDKLQGEDLISEGDYSFRYKENQLAHIRKGRIQSEDKHLSLFWIIQPIKMLNKQSFNPYILNKLLSKLIILPINYKQAFNQELGLNRIRKNDSNISKIFDAFLYTVNSFDIWEQVTKIMNFQIIKLKGQLVLAKTSIQQSTKPQVSKLLFFSLKLLRTLLKLNKILVTHQQTSKDHFIIKAISSIRALSPSQLSKILGNNSSKDNLLMSLLTNISADQPLANDSIRSIDWEAQQMDQSNVLYPLIFNYARNNQLNIDFNVVNNSICSPMNKYIQNHQNLTTISLQIIIQLLEISPSSSIEQTLVSCRKAKEEERPKFKQHILGKIERTLQKYIRQEEYYPIKHKIMKFIFDLKHGVGDNNLNYDLADRLFDCLLSSAKNIGHDSKLSNLLMLYLLKELEQSKSKYQNIVETTIHSIITNIQFKDSPLNNSMNIKDSQQIGFLLQKYYSCTYGKANVHQMERLIQQRTIVTIADQLLCIQYMIRAILILLVRKRNPYNLIGCINSVNNFIASNNLLLIQNDLPFQCHCTAALTHQQLLDRLQQPRLFLRDPLELYLTKARQPNQKEQIQTFQTNNCLQWFLFIANNLSHQINIFTQFILTIDKHLYANNPIQYNIDRKDAKNIQFFCHLPIGRLSFSAVELFGKSEGEAVSVVRLIAENAVERLVKQAANNRVDTIKWKNSFRVGLQIVGYCLQWLRSRSKNGSSAVQSLIIKLNRHYQVLLSDITSASLKVFISSFSIAKQCLSHQARQQINKSIYNLLLKYRTAHKEMTEKDDLNSMKVLVQQSITLLLANLPGKHELHFYQLLVDIWAEETNYQYFFNLSRLILELSSIYPEEIVKFKPLIRCKMIQQLNNQFNRYQDRERQPTSMAWLWVVKIATALACHHRPTLIINEITAFMKQYRTRIINMISYNQEKITKGYLQDLQGTMELLITLFSQQIWVSLNINLIQQITYILSHSTVKLFVNQSQGKNKFMITSNNDKGLSSIKPLHAQQMEMDVQDSNNITHKSIFQLEMSIKMMYCFRNYSILMNKAFKISLYVQKYFQNIIANNLRYYTSFWDNFNKCMVSMLAFSLKQISFWGNQTQLNNSIKLMNKCYNAPHTFIDNGYLSSVIQLPQSSSELLADIYLLCYLITQLSVVHYLKQKIYMKRYNNLMRSHLDTFEKRIREHVKQVKSEELKLKESSGQIKESHWDKLLLVLDNNSKK